MFHEPYPIRCDAPTWQAILVDIFAGFIIDHIAGGGDASDTAIKAAMERDGWRRKDIDELFEDAKDSVLADCGRRARPADLDADCIAAVEAAVAAPGAITNGGPQA